VLSIERRGTNHESNLVALPAPINNRTKGLLQRTPTSIPNIATTDK